MVRRLLSPILCEYLEQRVLGIMISGPIQVPKIPGAGTRRHGSYSCLCVLHLLSPTTATAISGGRELESALRGPSQTWIAMILSCPQEDSSGGLTLKCITGIPLYSLNSTCGSILLIEQLITCNHMTCITLEKFMLLRYKRRQHNQVFNHMEIF